MLHGACFAFTPEVLKPQPTWLARRYNPGVEIDYEISRESDRVRFLQSVAQVMLTKARMKLNIKKLYAADGNSVKEMLKIASLLYQATAKAGDVEDVSVIFLATLPGNAHATRKCLSHVLTCRILRRLRTSPQRLKGLTPRRLSSLQGK
jgi:hypothetical protein